MTGNTRPGPISISPWPTELVFQLMHHTGPQKVLVSHLLFAQSHMPTFSPAPRSPQQTQATHLTNTFSFSPGASQRSLTIISFWRSYTGFILPTLNEALFLWLYDLFHIFLPHLSWISEFGIAPMCYELGHYFN